MCVVEESLTCSTGRIPNMLFVAEGRGVWVIKDVLDRREDFMESNLVYHGLHLSLYLVVKMKATPQKVVPWKLLPHSHKSATDFISIQQLIATLSGSSTLNPKPSDPHLVTQLSLYHINS